MEGSPIISKFGPISRSVRSSGFGGSIKLLEAVADEVELCVYLLLYVYQNTVKSFDFVGRKFRGLMTSDMFVDT